MKKFYETPELEVSKFSLASDILVASSTEPPESSLPDFGQDLGPGYGWSD